MSALEPIVPSITQGDGGLPGALAETLAALHEETIARLARMEERMLGRARGAALLALVWGGGIATALVAWACAQVALALWLSSAHGAVVAAVVAAAIHGAAALAFFACALGRRSSP